MEAVRKKSERFKHREEAHTRQRRRGRSSVVGAASGGSTAGAAAAGSSTGGGAGGESVKENLDKIIEGNKAIMEAQSLVEHIGKWNHRAHIGARLMLLLGKTLKHLAASSANTLANTELAWRGCIACASQIMATIK